VIDIDLENYNLDADEYGSINLYKEEYGEDICLGEISEEGIYTHPWWMKGKEGIEEIIKGILIEQYFGERVSHAERDQNIWAERYVKFMNLEAIERDTYSSYEKISNDSDENLSCKGRFLNTKGVSLNGIYRSKKEGLAEVCVINEGKLLYSWTSPDLEIDGEEDYNNLHLSGRYNWRASNKQALNYNYSIFKNFITEKIHIAEFFCPSKKVLLNQIDEIEKIGAAYLIYPHNEDAEKFRIISSSKKSLSEILDIKTIKGQLKKIAIEAQKHNKLWDVKKLDLLIKYVDEIDESKPFDLTEYDIQNGLTKGMLMKFPINFIFHSFMEDNQ